MKELKIAVCDDDITIMDMVSGCVSTLFGRQNVAAQISTFFSAGSLSQRMEDTQFDLIFLDIQMPGESGIRFAKRLRESGNETPIIYVSSREDKIFDAVQTQAFGFVRKARFLSDMTQVTERFLQYCRSQQKEDSRTVVFQQKNGIVSVRVSLIRYIEGSGKQQLLYRSDSAEPVVLHSTMETLTEYLEPVGFIRVHKGFIVNSSYIAAIRNEVELVGGGSVPLSRRTSQQVREQYLAMVKGGGSLIL